MQKRRAMIISASLLLTFIVMRLYLHTWPSTNFDVGPYNIHHLFTGLLMLTFAGIPLILFHQQNPWMDLCALLFGIGLSMALDEWVYLIVTDGSDSAYLLPVSLWGGALMVVLGALYTIGLYFWAGPGTDQ